MVINGRGERLSEMGMSEPFHLEFELMARYAERRADAIDREIVETHAEDCPRCRGEVDDLAAYAGKPSRRAAPFAAAAALFLVIAAAATFVVRRGTEVTAPVPPVPRGTAAVPVLHIPPLAMELAASERMLRGSSRVAREIEPLAPVGTMILNDRPRFEWAGTRHTKYRVEVFDEQFHPVASSPPLSSFSWMPPKPLPGATTYVWQVTAEIDGQPVTFPRPPAPEARFHVIDRAQVEAIDTLSRRETRPSLAVSVAYADAGALLEAQQELSALLAANRNAETARRLLRDVQLHTP